MAAAGQKWPPGQSGLDNGRALDVGDDRAEPAAQGARLNDAGLSAGADEQHDWRRPRRRSVAETRRAAEQAARRQPVILITEAKVERQKLSSGDGRRQEPKESDVSDEDRKRQQEADQQQQQEQYEEVDGISYRIVAAVTAKNKSSNQQQQQSTTRRQSVVNTASATMNTRRRQSAAVPRANGEQVPAIKRHRFSSVRRKSSALVSNLINTSKRSLDVALAASRSSHELQPPEQRRMSIYEMTKSPPPETSIEMYLNERRRSSTVSAKFVQQQLEQQFTFETNYQQRQQYFKDLNEKLINHDKKLLNVVANRGPNIHRHSVDIAQLPLHLAKAAAARHVSPLAEENGDEDEDEEEEKDEATSKLDGDSKQQTEENRNNAQQDKSAHAKVRQDDNQHQRQLASINQVHALSEPQEANEHIEKQTSNDNGTSTRLAAAGRAKDHTTTTTTTTTKRTKRLASISEDSYGALNADQHRPVGRMHSLERRLSRKQQTVVRKFQKLDSSALTSTPAPDVKIGQRVAYKEYYGSEFGTIRWIGRVPQISPDWTVGIEFDNAIGEGDGSLNGRRYFIAKDCFAKFLPLDQVALVDQHVGRPEPGTMISVMSAAVRPGQMISIQRVSTVHVQHCFLNAPHRRPGAEFLAVNTRLHCQCPNCGPCAHVVKPPRTQRLRTGKNATHMCQFSTYTCCGMESQEEAMCTYTGNKISSTPPPTGFPAPPYGGGLPPIGNSWIEGSGYLSNLQAEQSKLMPEEYRLGAAPEDIGLIHESSKTSSRRGSGKHDQNQNFSSRHQNDERRDKSPASETSNYKWKKSHDRDRDHDDGAQYQKSSSINQQEKAICNIVNCSCQKVEQYEVQRVSEVSKNDELPVANNGEQTKLNDSLNKTARLGITEYDYKKGIGCEVNNLDEIEFTSATRETSASVRDKKEVTTTDDSHQPSTEDNINGLEEAQGEPKTPKVLYRDSIENRYLFPTDDVIDSTLEADLENLSQARYGHVRGGTHQNGTSRNIFKSLRSLVSCLSTKSNDSEFERHSENTMRIYERPTNEINKSRPICYDSNNNNNNRTCNHGCSRCGSDLYSDEYRQKGALSNDYIGTTAEIDTLPPPPFDSCVDFLSVGHESNLDLKKNNSYAPTNRTACAYSEHHSENFHDQNKQQQHHSKCPMQKRNEKMRTDGNGAYQQRKFGSSEASSSNGCWSSCGGLANAEFRATRTTTRATTFEQQIRRQISSSSDCGFSSASQNSINFASTPPLFSPVNMVGDEQRHINQVYKKIASRLIGTSSSSVTNEDLLKLKSALTEMHSESCCLHTSYADSYNRINNRQSLDKTEYEQLIADIMKKTLVDVKPQNQQQPFSNERNRSDERTQIPDATDGLDNIKSKSKESNGDCTTYISANLTGEKQQMEDSTLTLDDGRIYFEKDESKLARDEKNDKSVGLPRAFELKLTLSINADQTGAKQTNQDRCEAKNFNLDNHDSELNKDGAAQQHSD